VVLSDRRNRVWLWVLAAVAALAGIAGPRALAQAIPDAIRTKTSELGPEEVQVVTKYVEDHSKNLTSTDPQLLKRDRDDLLEPLSKKDTSVPFRIAYDRALEPKLADMVANADKMVVINGLNIAGDLATDRAITVIESKADDKDPSVRYQVGYALQRAFEAAQNAARAATVQALDAAVKRLEQRIALEKDANVADRWIRAGLAGAGVPELTGDAVGAVARGAIQAAKGLNNPGSVMDAMALLRAAVGVRDVLAQRGSGLNGQAAKDAAEMAGALVARAARMVQKKQLPAGASTERSTYSQVVSAAQTVVQLAGQALGNANIQILGVNGQPVQLNESLNLGNAGGDAKFAEDAQLLVGPGGVLSKPPFDLPPEKFK
jgi:hypothetical protein